MNLISFANFNISENQTSLLPSMEKDGKPEDFSALLNNIFVALQTANSPAPNFSSGFEQNGVQVQTVSDGGQNFVLGNNQILPANLFNHAPVLPANTENPASIKTNVNQNILPTVANSDEKVFLPIPKPDSPLTFTPTENLLSIPENFQPAPKLPTMQNVLTENRAEQNSSKVSQIVQPINQSENAAQSANAELPFSSKDFEILSDSETNIFLPRSHYSFATPLKSEQNSKPLQVFKNISDSIRETDLPKVASIKTETVLSTNNFTETKISTTASPFAKPNAASIEVVNPKIEEAVTTPIVLASEKPEQMTKPTISTSEEIVENPTVLPSANLETSETETAVLSPKPSVVPTISEESDVKLSKNLEVTQKTESPINLDSDPKVIPVSENVIKTEIPPQQNKFTSNEVSNVSIVEPRLETKSQVVLEAKPIVMAETKPQVEAEIKSTINLDLTPKIEAVAEKQPNNVSLPVESEIQVKTGAVRQPQINFKSANKSIFEEIFPNDPIHLPDAVESVKPLTPSFSVSPIISEPKQETILSQSVSLNLDSQVVESVEVKPQIEIPVINENVQLKPENVVVSETENTVSNKVIESRFETSIPSQTIQPKIPNKVIDESSNPKLVETPKPDFVNESIKPISVNESAELILSDSDLINFSLPVDDSPAPVLAADKPIQPQQVSEETVKTNLVENKPTEVKPQVDNSSLLQNLVSEVDAKEIKTVKPKLNNFLNDTEAAEKTPVQVNSLPENQRTNQLQTVVSSEVVQTENPIKVSSSGTSQNFSFSEKPEAEIKPKDIENNLPLNFDKVIENAVKDTKVVETNLKNQTDPTKIAEQINPHLLEMAGLVEKRQEKEILKLRLHPAELGTVEITLEKNSSGVLNAHFKTETAEAQQALSKGLEQLRETLQNNGWNIGQMDITSGSNSTTDNQNRQNNQQKSEWIENFAFNRSSEQPDETENNSPKRLLNLQA